MELRQYETRISELEAVVREQSIHSIQRIRYEQEIRVREEELRRARLDLDTARRERDNLQRYELQNSRLGQEKQSLTMKVNSALNEIEYYKEEMIRSRLEIQKRLAADKQKHIRNLEISLDECKTENQVLSRKKVQLQAALEVAHKEVENLKRASSPIKSSEYNMDEVQLLREENATLTEKLNEALYRVCAECEENQKKVE